MSCVRDVFVLHARARILLLVILVWLRVRSERFKEFLIQIDQVESIEERTGWLQENRSDLSLRKNFNCFDSLELQAGLVTTLNTRTTVFGVTNPKGHYDPAQRILLSGPRN